MGWDWLNPGGGLRYHLRSMRYRETLWRPHREHYRRWSSDWQPPVSQVLVIGMGAGHTFPWEWLPRVPRTASLEIDPIAIAWQRGRARHLPDHYASRGDFFRLLKDVGTDPKDWSRRFFGNTEPTGFWFNLFLGQAQDCWEVRKHGPWDEFFPRVRDLLSKSHWLSVHDYFHSAAQAQDLFWFPTEGEPHSQEVALQFYGYSREPIYDYSLGSLWTGLRMRNLAYWSWPLTPAQSHVLEARMGSPVGESTRPIG